MIGATWTEVEAGPYIVVIRRSRSRHYTARAYRGTALAAILKGQRAVLDFIHEVTA